jgi:hypothetical protein
MDIIHLQLEMWILYLDCMEIFVQEDLSALVVQEHPAQLETIVMTISYLLFQHNVQLVTFAMPVVI